MILLGRTTQTLAMLIAVSTLSIGCGKDEGFSDRLRDPIANPGASGSGGGSSTIGGAGSGGAGAQGGSGPISPPVNSQLATACINDNNCAAGLTCLESTSDVLFGGGPAGGLCTAECSTDVDCEDHDASAVCILVSQDGGYCFPSCTVGPPALGEVKCQNRSTLTCSQSPSGFGSVCLPSCGSDLDCGDRRCDLANGVCVDELIGTKAIGEECDIDAAEPECEGGCLELAEGYAICSGLCNFGFGGCGLAPTDSVGAGDPICLPFSAEGSIGDLGFCLQRCDCDGDCKNNISVCNAFEDQATQDAISAAGLCFPDSLQEQDGSPIQGIECAVNTDAGAMTPVDGG